MNLNALIRQISRTLLNAGIYRATRKLGIGAVVAVAIVGAIGYALTAR